ncbi:TetR/AcrR family transcriptional regulator [Lentzea sp. NPDC051213]|uniref:TetR/AcrR family transcriptional regulator n=1 Tax=Lentzea sp. NPDC051213 TaxID=3364126 RepID=UPI0037ABE5CD
MSDARSRLLGTASRLFYAEGLHSVGVDRILAEAKVTRATMYRHFAGKEDLVVAYLGEADRATRQQVESAVASASSDADAVRGVARGIAEHIRLREFRGCAFLNAVAEYPDPAHPVHVAVLAHRQWFLDTVTELLERVGGAPAELEGRHFVMLRDGAMAAGCLTDPGPIGDTFLAAVEGILRSRGGATSPRAAAVRT